MKQANNNEVDLLLRSLARRSESMSGDGKRVFSDHLDADELNSHAEGVVPAPARARYTEHLADCQQCRRIVIGLTQAAGAARQYEIPDQPHGLSFWQKLAALFSPAVLRFAVPALALAGVIGIGWLLLRQQPQSDFIAQNRAIEPSSSSGQPSPSPVASEPSTSTQNGVKPQAVELNKEKNDLQEEKIRAAQAPVATDLNAKSTPLDKDATKSGQAGGVVESRPSYASEPTAPAPPSSSATLGEVAGSNTTAKEQPAKREERDEQERQREVFRNQSSDEHGPNRSAAPRASSATAAGRRDDGLMRSRGPSGQDKKAKTPEVEGSTMVAGRRFVREGNTWIDTAYESSRATINVTRGSEQYRSLVADEPGLRTIAEQLRGVVIVVWKNRVYRIQ